MKQVVSSSTITSTATSTAHVGGLRRQRIGGRGRLGLGRGRGNVLAAANGLLAVRPVQGRVGQRDAVLFHRQLGHCVGGQVGHGGRARGQAFLVPFALLVLAVAVGGVLFAMAPGGRREGMGVAGAASGF